MLQSAILIKPHPFFTWALMEVFFPSAFSLSWITTSTKEKYTKILHHSGHIGIVYICRTQTCIIVMCDEVLVENAIIQLFDLSNYSDSLPTEAKERYLSKLTSILCQNDRSNFPM
ncbi:uncharacterized protein LOC124320603 [Daphnia pulicaria]|uniref:uncharacterized protein LOC124320603 n=1 Tax=Daphnia pulicaria TaxID=35523 RepID=UPI001EEA5D3B|nr:uncharacterized protein LOC124320603 [Daphnia pulicaria]